jgi:hypothetical protein
MESKTAPGILPARLHQLSAEALSQQSDDHCLAPPLPEPPPLPLSPPPFPAPLGLAASL